jgi:hypothetical protein
MKTFIVSALFLFQPLILTAELTDSILIAYYPFNGNANDESCNGNDGTVYGATLMTDSFNSIAESVYYFDGIDDYIKIGTLPELTVKYNSFSLSFWIKSGSDVSQWTSIIRSVNNAAYGMTLGLDIHRNGKEFQFGRLSFDTRSNDSKFFSFTVDVPEIFNNQWHHLVYNLEDISNNKASVYIDGESKNITYHTTQGPNDYTQFENPFVLGAGNARGIIEKFYKGSLDDFRISTRVLTKKEIDSLYHERGFISIETKINHISCYGKGDGSIELTPVDGNPPFKFDWSTGDTISRVDSLAAGEYSVLITDKYNSKVRFETFLITEPLPITVYSVNYNIIPCFGDSTGVINLSVTGGTGNLKYYLSDSNSWQDSGFFTGLYAGKYIISVMDENNCKIHSNEIIIDQNDKLSGLTIIGKTEVEEYEQTIYSVSQTLGSQWEWFASGGNIIYGQNTNVVTIHWASTGTGKIWVIENTAEGCTRDTARLSVNIGRLFINDINHEELKICPNPLTEYTTIQFPNPMNERFQLYLSNLEGQIVKILDNIYSNKIVISSEYLPRGYYIIELRGSKIYRDKLLVQ